MRNVNSSWGRRNERNRFGNRSSLYGPFNVGFLTILRTSYPVIRIHGKTLYTPDNRNFAFLLPYLVYCSIWCVVCYLLFFSFPRTTCPLPCIFRNDSYYIVRRFNRRLVRARFRELVSSLVVWSIRFREHRRPRSLTVRTVRQSVVKTVLRVAGAFSFWLRTVVIKSELFNAIRQVFTAQPKSNTLYGHKRTSQVSVDLLNSFCTFALVITTIFWFANFLSKT